MLSHNTMKIHFSRSTQAPPPPPTKETLQGCTSYSAFQKLFEKFLRALAPAGNFPIFSYSKRLDNKRPISEVLCAE